MGVALIAWGRFIDSAGNKITVPAPTTEPGSPWLWDFIAQQSSELATIGFTHIQLPPVSKAQGGAGAGCDGYGVFCRRDLGSLPQQGSTPTRYGTADQLLRLIGVCRANGLEVLLDVVMHQLIGENGGPGVFEYLGSDGKTKNGRGLTAPGWFRGGTGSNDPIPPFCPEDNVPSVYYDFPFGRELSYQNCNPPRVTTDDALDYCDWLLRRTGASGMRVDDVKGTWTPFVAELLNSGTMKKTWAYAEYFDGNPSILNNWVISNPMDSRCSVEDFTLHWALQNSCNNNTANGLNGAGYTTWNSYKAVTFTDNPDTDTSPGQQIISNKLLAYAFIMTIEGFPFVYGKDYYPASVWPGAYGLKEWIDNLVWIHENLASGGTQTQYADQHVIVLNRLGEPGLLTGLNFDTWNAHTVTCPTSFGPNVQLNDYSGHGPDIWTDGAGNAKITIPANSYANGQSYVCYSRAGLGKPNSVAPARTVQDFDGADDLDIPALTGNMLPICRVWAEAGTDISFVLKPQNATGFSSELLISGPNGAAVARGKTTNVYGKTAVRGWHTLTGMMTTGATASMPFTVTADYLAPKTFDTSEFGS